jgi:hypothetical protein
MGWHGPDCPGLGWGHGTRKLTSGFRKMLGNAMELVGYLVQYRNYIASDERMTDD